MLEWPCRADSEWGVSVRRGSEHRRGRKLHELNCGTDQSPHCFAGRDRGVGPPDPRKIEGLSESIARKPGGISEHFAIFGRNTW